MSAIRVWTVGLCLLAAAFTAPADAAPAKRKAATPSGATSRASKRATATPAKQDAAATGGAAARGGAVPARTVAAPRRLEDIHIEGEIPAPQVLFVTARDQRRLTRFHHRRYLMTSAQVGEATPLPTRVTLTTPPPAPAGTP